MGEHMDARPVRSRAGLRRRRAADQHGLVPRRLRPVRKDVAHARGDDADQAARVRPRQAGHFRFRAKHKLQVRTTLVDSELADAIKELLAQPGGARLFRYGVERRVLHAHRRGPQRLHPRAHGRGVHGQGLPDVGRDADRGDRARGARGRRDRDRGEAGRRERHAHESANGSEIRPQSHAPRTSARRSSSSISTGERSRISDRGICGSSKRAISDSIRKRGARQSAALLANQARTQGRVISSAASRYGCAPLVRFSKEEYQWLARPCLCPISPAPRSPRVRARRFGSRSTTPARVCVSSTSPTPRPRRWAAARSRAAAAVRSPRRVTARPLCQIGVKSGGNPALSTFSSAGGVGSPDYDGQMGLALVVGPAKAGKIARLLEGYLAAIERDPVLIVPNRADVDRIERDLLRRAGALLAGSIGTFDDVFRELALGAADARAVTGDAQRALRRPADPRRNAAEWARPLGALCRLRRRAPGRALRSSSPACSSLNNWTEISGCSTPPTGRSSIGSASGIATCFAAARSSGFARSSTRGTAGRSSPTGSRI